MEMAHYKFIIYESKTNRRGGGFRDAGEQTPKRARYSLFLLSFLNVLSVYPHFLLHPLSINPFFLVPFLIFIICPAFPLSCSKGTARARCNGGRDSAWPSPRPDTTSPPQHRSPRVLSRSLRSAEKIEGLFKICPRRLEV